MTKPLLAAALPLALCACATLFTPDRCETALAAADTAEALALLLVERGIEPERAARIAEGVFLGRVALSAACSAPEGGIGEQES
jgi:hypothetical protein